MFTTGESGSLANSVEAMQQAEKGRGRPLDFLMGAQDNRTWNALKGMSLLDWMPKDRPLVVDLAPFPLGDYSWRAAANGDYDKEYRTIGKVIVSKRPAETTVLRLAWEMNLTNYAHKADKNFVAGFRRAVQQIRIGAGDSVDHLVIDWSLGGLQATAGFPPFSLYPGDDVVDVVGLDEYDNPKNTTQAQFNAHMGRELSAVYGFARSHKKWFAVDEWGGANGIVNGASNPQDGGDNPELVSLFYAWIRSHLSGLAWESYFETASAESVNNALFNPTILPLAAARYRQELAAG
jgi:hypothetical protein